MTDLCKFIKEQKSRLESMPREEAVKWIKEQYISAGIMDSSGNIKDRFKGCSNEKGIY